MLGDPLFPESQTALTGSTYPLLIRKERATDLEQILGYLSADEVNM